MELFKLFGTIAIDNAGANKAIDDTTKKASTGSGKITKAFKTIGNVTVAIAKGVSVIGGAVSTGLAVAVEGTREYRTEMGKLQASFKTSGHSAKTAKKTYSELNAVLGDSGQAVEASQHLAKLTKNQKQLKTWTNICTGVYATFGASLPIEGLTESANETAKVGQVTGSLADALNWAGISEDAFNEKLAKCSNESERQDLIMNTLNNTYKKASEQYKKTNKDVLEANKAQERLDDSMAKIGAAVEPIMTGVKNAIAGMAEKAVPLITGLIEKFQGIKDVGDKLQPVFEFVLDKVVKFATGAVPVIENVRKKFVEVGSYIIEKLQPVFNALRKVFVKVKNAIQPLIDAISDYVTSGEAAEDATKAVKKVIDLLEKALSAVADGFKKLYDKFEPAIKAIKKGVGGLIDKFKDYVTSGEAFEDITQLMKDAVDLVVEGVKKFSNWCKEHKETLENIAIVFGSFATAVLAVKGALWLAHAATVAWNAIVGIGTAITTGFTAVTTALGTAFAFLTSPIGLVILAIGSIIAIVVLCIKYWDEIKAAGKKAWEGIKKTFKGAGEWFNSKVVKPVVGFFTELGKSISETAQDAWKGVKKAFSNVGTWFKTKFESAGTNIKNAFSTTKTFFSDLWKDIKKPFVNVASWFKTKFTDAWQGVKDVFSTGGQIFDGIKEGISGVFTTVVNGLIKGINKIIATPFKTINGLLNDIRSIKVAGAKPFSGLWDKNPLPVPEIPQLAKGGVLKKGQTAFLEGQGDEAVIPLSQNTQWIDGVAARLNSAENSSEMLTLLKSIVEILARLDKNMIAYMMQALQSMQFEINNREFARLVKGV